MPENKEEYTLLNKLLPLPIRKQAKDKKKKKKKENQNEILDRLNLKNIFKAIVEGKEEGKTALASMIENRRKK